MYEEKCQPYPWSWCSFLVHAVIGISYLHVPRPEIMLTPFNRLFSSMNIFTGKIISGFAVYFRYNRPNTSRNFDFDANGPAVLENIDRVVGISPTCDATWNITTSGLAVAVFVLPVKGGIANIRIWRNCRASWKTWNVAEISLVPARYDYFRFGDRFYFRYKVMSDGVGITTMEVLHLENVNVALEICSYLSITRCK